MPVESLLVLLREGERNFQLVGHFADFEIGQEAGDEIVTRGIPFPLLRERVEMTETEVQQAVSHHVGPLIGRGSFLRIGVENALFGYNNPSIVCAGASRLIHE